MKILIINNRYRVEGGEEAVVASQIGMLKKFGHDVILYERSNREIENLTLYKKFLFFMKDMVWSKETYNEIREIIRKEKPDIAHIHNIFFILSPSIYYALNEENTPIVQSLHNYRFFCPNKGLFYRNGKICEECSKGNFMSFIFYRCGGSSFILTLFLMRMLKFHSKMRTFHTKINSFIASSEFSKNKLIELGLPKDKIFVNHNFFDIRVEEERIHEDYALFIGRLFDYKGIHTLFSAFKKLSNSRVKIIGNGPLLRKFSEKAKKVNNVEILGWLPEDKKIEFLKRTSFLIFPSEAYENMPRTIIEAFACGVPVIAARLGGMGELVEDGRTGLHFNPGDPEELAFRIEWAWKNPEKMKEMGKQAKKEYKEKYTAEKNYEVLMNIYRQTINNYNS